MRLLLAVLAASLLTAGPAAAASPSPDLIGGSLSANPQRVTLTSTATMPVAVVMSADGPFSLTPSTFTVDPEETVTMTVIGEPKGKVTAQLRTLEALAGDSSGVNLKDKFPQPAPPEIPWVQNRKLR